MTRTQIYFQPLFFILLLTACANLFTPAPSPTPTEIPVPEFFASLPAEFSPVLRDGQWKLHSETSGMIPDFYYDAGGFHLTLPDGTLVNIPTFEISRRVQIGQGDVLQVYNEIGTAIDYAYDKEENRWLAHDEVIQTDKSNPENYIQIATWDELKTLFRQEKMFMLPFPENTYWPPADKILIDYMNNSSANKDPDAEFNYWYPLGRLGDERRSPLRLVNYINLQIGEERTNNILIVTEQVYNSEDNSFSTLPFGFEGSDTGQIELIIEMTASGRYLLPWYRKLENMTQLSVDPYFQNLFRYFRENGYVKSDGSMPQIKALTEEWFNTGHVPPELENIIHMSKIIYLIETPSE